MSAPTRSRRTRGPASTRAIRREEPALSRTTSTATCVRGTSNATITAPGGGINAFNWGTGDVTVSTGSLSSITAPGTGTGINAQAFDGGNVSVVNKGAATGATGLFAKAVGTGSVMLENDGQIAATSFSAINVSQNSAGSSGSTTITNTGTVLGAANHSAINVTENATGTATINNSGAIGSSVISSSSPAITENGGGPIVINNSGQINGAIYTNGTGDFTGTFNNNAGAAWNTTYLGDDGNIIASGAGSAVNVLSGNSVSVGDHATGSMTIEARAVLTTGYLNIGNLAGSTGAVTVTGAGSEITNT